MIEHDTSRGLPAARSVSPSRPQRRHQPGPEGLDQHVGARAELARQLAVARVAEVERDRALVAVEPEVVGASRRRATAAPRGACRRPPSGPLDLDHVGAEVAQHHRGERAREHAREVGDEEAVERAGDGGHRARSLVSGPMRDARRLRPPPRLHAAAPTCCAAPSCARRCSRRVAGVDRLRDPRRRARAARERRSATRPSSPATCSPTSGARSGPTASSCCVGGNHDHGLVAGWIDGRLQTEPPGFLGLEQRDRARRRPARSPRALAERAAPARVTRRLSRPVAARRRLRDPRPLLRPPHAPCRRSSASPPARWRAGSSHLPDGPRDAPTTTRPRSRRSTRGCTRSSSAPRTAR